MRAVDESVVEQATLEWLSRLGYAVMHRGDLSLGAEDAPRRRYSEVVLKPRLH